MKQAPIPTCLFLDIGGVLHFDGWGHHSRERVAAHFKLNRAEMEDRHRLTFEADVEGKLTRARSARPRKYFPSLFLAICDR
jgi:hypothetical protein